MTASYTSQTAYPFPDAALVTRLVAEARDLVHYSIPPYGMPQIWLEPQSVLQEHLFRNVGHRGYVGGFFDPGSGRDIYLDEDQDYENDIEAQSIVFHEIVHWLQASAGVSAYHVPIHLIEREAYGAQLQWMHNKGVTRLNKPVFSAANIADQTHSYKLVEMAEEYFGKLPQRFRVEPEKNSLTDWANRIKSLNVQPLLEKDFKL